MLKHFDIDEDKSKGKYFGICNTTTCLDSINTTIDHGDSSDSDIELTPQTTDK